MKKRMHTSIGLMSGTSLDGIDVAVIETDGETVNRLGPTLAVEYRSETRNLLKTALDMAPAWDSAARMPDLIVEAEYALTLEHAEAVRTLLSANRIDHVDLIGFHGQTIHHAPHERRTVQIGDGELLAYETGIDVVCDFRSADVAAGGEGAPLAPLYHKSLVRSLKREEPTVVLNLGGVANVTYIHDQEILAFDTGPANAPINDWIERHTGAVADFDGMHSFEGKISSKILKRMLETNWFGRLPPKSLDRNDFDFDAVKGLSINDGAATLTAFSAEAVARAREHFPEEPTLWVVCGGGRHNPALMAELTERCMGSVVSAENVGWRGDFIEAEAFAFLAVRSFYGLPLSLPSTTNVPKPITGGCLHRTVSVSPSSN